MRLMPASMAAWMVAMLSASSLGPYMPDIPMQPKASGETCGPASPSVMAGDFTIWAASVSDERRVPGRIVCWQDAAAREEQIMFTSRGWSGRFVALWRTGAAATLLMASLVVSSALAQNLPITRLAGASFQVSD